MNTKYNSDRVLDSRGFPWAGVRTLLVVSVVLVCSAPAWSKVTLLFNIDQSLSNGPVQTDDLVGVSRVAADLKAFQSRYNVYAILSTTQADKTRLTSVLDLLAADKIPFVLDVYGSDVVVVFPGVAPYDRSHGQAVSIEELQTLKHRYGDMFAGVRTMEVFAMNFGLQACKLKGENWISDESRAYWPQDNFFQAKYVEQYLNFVSRNKMFLIYSDWYWSFDHHTDFDKNTVKQADNEGSLRDLLKKYPNVCVPMYANNDVDSRNWLYPPKTFRDSWVAHFRPWLKQGALGIGLSDQAWIINPELNCPVSILIDWAKRAIKSGVGYIETEPYWYWWKFPRGALQAVPDYTKDPAWVHRGAQTDRLVALAEALSVTLPDDDR